MVEKVVVNMQWKMLCKGIQVVTAHMEADICMLDPAVLKLAMVAWYMQDGIEQLKLIVGSESLLLFSSYLPKLGLFQQWRTLDDTSPLWPSLATSYMTSSNIPYVAENIFLPRTVKSEALAGISSNMHLGWNLVCFGSSGCLGCKRHFN